ncbi:hypothetical protein B0J14DRAFT_305365 [Halenospora varia]|nr:hypothetical protein B0J14DRAFT_305365 [Halenospora varia]
MNDQTGLLCIILGLLTTLDQKSIPYLHLPLLIGSFQAGMNNLRYTLASRTYLISQTSAPDLSLFPTSSSSCNPPEKES